MHHVHYQRRFRKPPPRRWLSLPILLPAVAIVATAIAGRTMIHHTADVADVAGVVEVAVAPRGFALCALAPRQDCVIDGDTIRYGGVSIRLEDIDAPETHRPRCAAEAALGRRATERLLELVNAGPFEILRTGVRDEDRYGRKLRILARDGRSLAETLIAEGLARRWDGARRSWCG
jgi:micrococcal nuclease